MKNNLAKTKNIKQGLMIRASAHEIYDALMDSKKHAQFTGSPAKMSRKVGGRFSAFDGYAIGKNLELVPDEKIVQTWRASDWPEGRSSIITYLLKETDGGTKLMFSHRGVPANDAKNVADGWKTYYWQPLKKMLEK